MQCAYGYIFDRRYSGAYSRRMNKKDTISDVGRRLDEAMRQRFGTNQSALSRASEVPQPTIARILNGKVGKKGPEAETVKKLAEACQVRFDWLNQGIGPKQLGSEQLEVVKSPPPTEPPRHKEYPIDGEQLMEWIELYRTSTPTERKNILSSARFAREARASKRRDRNTGPN